MNSGINHGSRHSSIADGAGTMPHHVSQKQSLHEGSRQSKSMVSGAYNVSHDKMSNTAGKPMRRNITILNKEDEKTMTIEKDRESSKEDIAIKMKHK